MMRDDGHRNGIAVYGATGYTGRLIVRELVSQGHDVVVAGRDGAAVEQMAARYGGTVDRAVVALDDIDGLDALAARVRTIVNAAGPFARTCAPVARAAVGRGAHYVDISGEQQSIRGLFDTFGALATDRGVALVPASAFYATPCDLLVSLAAQGLGPLDDLDIAYHVEGWVPSGAALRNRIEGIALPKIQYDGGFVDVPHLPPTRFIDFGGSIGSRRTVLYPAPEVLTIPRHLDIKRLRTSMSTSTLISRPALEALIPLITRLAVWGLRSPAAFVVDKLVAAITGGSTTRDQHDPTRFALVAHLHSASGRRTATLSGPGIFDITGPIAARVAAATLAAGFHAAGPLAAAEILDPRTFLDNLADRGIEYHIE